MALSDLIAAGREHNRAESSNDFEGTMGTLEGEPRYELYPVALAFTGRAITDTYYRHFFRDVAPDILGYELHAEWEGEAGVCQEYTVRCRIDGVVRPHRVIGILTFGREKLSGERIFSDELFLRFLFGPVWNKLTPVYPDAAGG